jgi:polyhydroxyalkanoate synthase
MVGAYLMGRQPPASDLMTWNADATRMPYRMHAEYLERLFLHNDLAEGRYPVDGRPVVLGDIQLPSFLVGTETDHVAPWRSVFKYLLLNEADARFVLTSGGHNAGIVSPPGRPHRHYRLLERRRGSLHPSPDAVLARPAIEGSWWPAWTAWLADQSKPPSPCPAPVLPAIGPAPGRYVLER